MGCRSCGSSSEREGPCDVCILVRDDHSVKKGVRYCQPCQAWICPVCRPNYKMRTIAALRKAKAEAKALMAVLGEVFK